jgi:hypothetical protein
LRFVAELQKYIDHFGMVRNAPIGTLGPPRPGARLRHAGRRRESPRAASQNFLTTWKDADSDVPILIQAKAAYANL